MSAEVVTTIDAIFSPSFITDRNTLHDNRLILDLRNADATRDGYKQKWITELKVMIDALSQADQIHDDVKGEAVTALDTFIRNPDHGIDHSYNVYIGMHYLAQESGWDRTQRQAYDSSFQAVAVLHDLAQLLPYKHPIQGYQLEGDARKLHAENMSALIYLMAPHLGLSHQSVRDIIQSIRHHDDTWIHHEHYPHLSDLGKLLADSDKLFAANLPEPDGKYDIRNLVAGMIERNLVGGTGLQGWYLVRTDLTDEQRAYWQYGDRWRTDVLPAIKADMLTKGYTEVGQQIFSERQHLLWEEAQRIYGDYYDHHRNIYDKWLRSTPIQVRLVGKNGKGKEALYRQPEKTTPSEILEEAMNMLVDVEARGILNTPKGWKVFITFEDEEALLDPSAVIFSSKEEFFDAIKKGLSL